MRLLWKTFTPRGDKGFFFLIKPITFTSDLPTRPFVAIYIIYISDLNRIEAAVHYSFPILFFLKRDFSTKVYLYRTRRPFDMCGAQLVGQLMDPRQRGSERIAYIYT